MAKLTIDQEKFLQDYHPEDDMITSNDEIDKIVSIFDLGNTEKSQYQAIRNAVVDLYHDLRLSCTDSEKSWNLSQGMMSVTSVIDAVKIGYI